MVNLLSVFARRQSPLRTADALVELGFQSHKTIAYRQRAHSDETSDRIGGRGAVPTEQRIENELIHCFETITQALNPGCESIR